MAWELSSWLVLVRCLQLLGGFASACANGFLYAFIYINDIGVTDTMGALEWMSCIFIVYTALVLLILHTKGRSAQTSWLVGFLVADVIFMGMILGIITLLARSGVPSHCGGFTSLEFTQDHDQNIPDDGYTTEGFSDEKDNARGELDRFCGIERAYYSISVAVLFSYTVTIVLSTLRICAGKYTKNTIVYQQLDALRRGNSTVELGLKQDDLELRPITRSASPRTPSLIPASEGVTSPPLSLRQPVINPDSPHHITQSIPLAERSPESRSEESWTSPLGSSPSSQSPRGQRPASRALRTLSVTSTSKPPPVVPVMIPEDSPEGVANAAMVTDGGRFSGGYQPGMPSLPPYSPRSPDVAGPSNGDGSHPLRDSRDAKS